MLSNAPKAAKHFQKKAAPGLYKLWKAYEPVNFCVHETYSPYQMKVVSPLFKDLPKKALHKAQNNWPIVAVIAAYVGVTEGLDGAFEASHREHWP